MSTATGKHRPQWATMYRKVDLARAGTPEPPLNVRKILSPVLIVSQCLGIRFYFWRNRLLIQCLVKAIISLVVVGCLYHELPSIKYWESNSPGLHGFIVKVDNISWWTCHVTNFWLTTLKNRKINAAIDQLSRTTLSLPYRSQMKLFRLNIFHLIVNMGMIVLYNVLGHDFIWLNSNHDFLTSKIYCFGDFIMLMPFYEFVQLVNLIGDLFKQINVSLKKVRRNHDSGDQVAVARFSTEEILKLRKSHLFLAKTCVEINSCFADQLLIVLFYSMVQVIYAARSIIGNFQLSELQEGIMNVIADSAWFTPFITFFIQMIIVCEKAAIESKKLLVTVHNFMNNYYGDDEILRELEIFAVQIQQHPIHFHVRFFNLQYNFFNTLLSSLMTYFVVIATFQGESDNGQLVSWNFKPPTTIKPEASPMKF